MLKLIELRKRLIKTFKEVNCGGSVMPKRLTSFLLRNKMTLKEFLEENLISSTNDQRAKLGLLLQEDNLSLLKKKENGYMVRDYTLTYLMKQETVNLIILFFNNVEFERLSNTF